MPTRKATHKWSNNDRELLCVLKIRYSRKYIAPIFNHLLSARLLREGFPNGVSAPSLDAQYQEMKTGGGGHEIYARISGLSDTDIKTEHKAHLRDIEQAIRSLRLNVQPSSIIARSLTKAQQNKPPRKKVRRANRVQETDMSDVSAEPEPIESLVRSTLQPFIHHRSPHVPSNERTNTGTDNSEPGITFDGSDTIPPTPRIYTDKNGIAAQARPLLLFRSTETVNLFRSRRYMNEKKPVRPPFKFNSQEYRDEAWPHLQRHKAYPSPFISFATKARNAIGRIEIETSENLDTKRFLAIFAFNDVEADAARNFGPGSGPHPVGSLFSKTEISDLPQGYKGSGEWLAYGYVECEPLVVLDSVQAVTLAKAIRRFSVGNVTALSDISQSLQDVPTKWKEAVSYVILQGYCASKLPTVGTPAYREMMESITGPRITSIVDPINLSRLSMVDDILEGEDEDTEEISPPYLRLQVDQYTPRTVQSMSVAAPANLRSPSAQRVHSVIQNLNILAARKASKKVLQRSVVESTPFWSPDPSEDTNTEVEKPQTTLDQAQALPLQETLNLDSANDDEDWELVNDDLEKSFVKSFPSAFKRVEHLRSANHLQANSEIYFDEEDEDYIVPSIENDQSYNDENLYGRGDFLCGLTRHAASITPPTQETPSKMPCNPISSQILNSRNNGVAFSIGDQPPTVATPKFSPHQTYVNRPSTRIQKPVLRGPGLARGYSRHGRDNTNTRTNKSTGTSNVSAWPRISMRTKVPVIIRKKIVDY